MAGPADSERLNEIATFLGQRLREGDTLTARCENGRFEFEVGRPADDDLAARHPELYGLLLEIEQDIDDAGDYLFTAYAIVAAALTWMVSQGTPATIGGFELQTLDGWGFYVAVWVGGLALWSRIDDGREVAAYRRHRPELARMLQSAKLDKRRFLTLIKDDEDLENVVTYVTKDRERF